MGPGSPHGSLHTSLGNACGGSGRLHPHRVPLAQALCSGEGTLALRHRVGLPWCKCWSGPGLQSLRQPGSWILLLSSALG